MGFYIRRSVNLGGGVRLNLSTGGLGISAGMKGLRVGMNGKGTYVHMGANGLYYRKHFSYQPSKSHPSISSSRQIPTSTAAQNSYGAVNLVQPIDVQSASADKQHIIDHFKPQTNCWYIAAGALTLSALIVLSSSALLAIAIFLVAIPCLAGGLILHRRTQLVYNLEELALERYQEFVVAFDEYFSSNRCWLYQTSTRNDDWKRNAGASAFIKRAPLIATSQEDRRLRSNISIPRLMSGPHHMYFLPDFIVVRNGASLHAIEYPNIDIGAAVTTFIEENGVPSDARVVHYTWKFVRKDGGPDRRFNNNRQIPVCAYQATIISTAGGVSRTFVKSKVSEFNRMAGAFNSMRDQIVTVTNVESINDRMAITYQPNAV